MKEGGRRRGVRILGIPLSFVILPKEGKEEKSVAGISEGTTTYKYAPFMHALQLLLKEFPRTFFFFCSKCLITRHAPPSRDVTEPAGKCQKYPRERRRE